MPERNEYSSEPELAPVAWKYTPLLNSVRYRGFDEDDPLLISAAKFVEDPLNEYSSFPKLGDAVAAKYSVPLHTVKYAGFPLLPPG
jgi:hypothetical protein